MKKIYIYASLLIVLSLNSFGQFGKNIVQYQDFNWKYIESKHFNIYYNEGAKPLADFAAIAAEEALASIQTTLKYRLAKRVSFIVYNSHNEFQQTNVIYQFMYEGIGGVTEPLKNRIVVPYQGNYAQFKHVIHHELVHAVMNDMFFGGTFQTAVASGYMTEIPIWMSEGLAEYESLDGLDPATDMFMRDISQSDYLPDLKYLDGYFAYRAGQSFYWFVAEKYGKDKISDLLYKLRSLPTVDAAFKSAFHMSLDDFSEQWKKELKKYYWPDISKFKDPDDFAVKLTDHKKDYHFYNSSPAISPDGEKMAFISDRGGIFGIYTRSIDKKDDIKELVSSFRKQDFEDLNFLTPGISWSPDGKKLAVSAKAGGEDAIFIVDVKTGDYDKKTFGFKSLTSVHWSPDGKNLAFIATVNEKSDVYLYNFASNKISNLTDDIYSDNIPVWTPDSKRIFFISDRGEQFNSSRKNKSDILKHDFTQSDVFSIDIESKEIKRITYTPDFEKTSIAISPDATKLLFVSDENGIGNIYELNFTTGRIKPLTNSLNGISQLSLSIDGGKLLFSTQINSGVDIYMFRSPFEKKLDTDTLPLTNYRREFLEKKKNVEQIAMNLNDTSKTIKEEPRQYGNFKLEYNRQVVVKPNNDVQESMDKSNTATIAQDSTFIEKNYVVNFSTDYIQGNPGYSTFWGAQGLAQMQFSDVLGDHRIILMANLLMDLKNSTFIGIYQYLPNVIDYNFSIFHSAGFVGRRSAFIMTSDSTGQYFDTLYRYRNYGIGVSASYPLDLFNRIEWGINWYNVSKENTTYLDAQNISRMLFVPEGAIVHDDVLWGYYSPVKGTRYNFNFKGVPKLSKSGVGFFTLGGDIRQYIMLNPYMSFALRGSAGVSMGPNPQHFFMGGVENWINQYYGNGTGTNTPSLPFDQPEDFAFIQNQFLTPMRGFAINERNGTQYFLSNFEFRFPLFRALLPGPIPIVFQSIMGLIFLDVGGIWSGDVRSFKSVRTGDDGNKMPDNLLMSSGIGIRTNIIGLPLKIDVAWSNLVYSWSQPSYLFSLGYDF